MSEQIDPTISKSRLFKSFSLSEATILAGLPLIAYLVLFVYQSGYFDVFQLPLQLITFSLADIFIATGALLGLGWILISFINVIFSLLPRNIPLPIAGRLKIFLPVLAIAIALFYLYPNQPSQWQVFCVAMIIISALLFLSPLLERSKKSYIEKMEIQDQVSSRQVIGDGSLVNRFVSLTGPNVFLALIYVIVILFIIYNSGRATALNQQVFRVANTSPETVVMYLTEGKAIVSPFNRNTGEIDPAFTIIDIISNTDILFRLEKVGPLRLGIIQDTRITSPIPTPSATTSETPSPTNSP